MKVHHGLSQPRIPAAAITMGSFDGFHRAHQHLVELLRGYRPQGLTPVLVTFEPHPRCVLDPDNCPKTITPLDEKLELMAAAGVEHAVILEFNRELAALDAKEFIERLLTGIEIRQIVVGPDFGFGRQRSGNVEWLHRHGPIYGFHTVSASPVVIGGEEVHSSRIRRLLTMGDMQGAAELLGRRFSMRGVVVPGDRIGRGLGYPTCNLAVAPNLQVPGNGIYAAWCRIRSGVHMAAVSIGYRPTFAGTQHRVEAFLLDFEGDLYHETIELEFVQRLRDELRFDAVADLVKQIDRDVDEVRTLLGSERRS